MELTDTEQSMLAGAQGRATQKAMQILTALGKIYGAQRLIPVRSVQIAGVSYDNLGEAGLQFLAEMASGGGKTRVFTTLNPAGMDVENWQALGIPADFARNQERVIAAFASMGAVTTCSCTPYLFGNLPRFGEHIAWAESSAVCYANSVLGARTNREGGPSALAAALTGLTPAYGYHLDENRRATLRFRVEPGLAENHEYGALGIILGRILEGRTPALGSSRPVAWIEGFEQPDRQPSLENLKSFCASLATYGGAALFHMPGVTPEAADGRNAPPAEQDRITITAANLRSVLEEMSAPTTEPADFVSLGCPHLSLPEIARIAALLEGRQVRREFWITTARPTKQLADRAGYTQIIEAAGARFAADTCCVVAPIARRFQTLVTDSAKACYYGSAKNKFRTVLKSFDEVVAEALRP